MTQPRGGEVGAELAELYKKGRDTLPLVEGEIDSAAGSVLGVLISDAMYRSGDIGVGSSGCYEEFAACRSSLFDLLNSLASQLETAGVNICKTAQNMADVDDKTATAFRNHGGEFPA